VALLGDPAIDLLCLRYRWPPTANAAGAGPRISGCRSDFTFIWVNTRVRLFLDSISN